MHKGKSIIDFFHASVSFDMHRFHLMVIQWLLRFKVLDSM